MGGIMFGLGFQEILIILILALLIFGAKKLPEIAKSLGRSISAFKRGMDGKEMKEKEEDENGRKSEEDDK
jgi:TatA/E family protein of Tat protein translocase